jgi:hypothetical protein
MSIKRTKQRSFGSRGKDSEEPGFGSPKPAEPVKTWAELIEGRPEESFVPYAMASTFPKGALIVHAKFGKGVVIGVEPSRIEVLFEEGAKKLGHGQPQS